MLNIFKRKRVNPVVESAVLARLNKPRLSFNDLPKFIQDLHALNESINSNPKLKYRIKQDDDFVVDVGLEVADIYQGAALDPMIKSNDQVIVMTDTDLGLAKPTLCYSPSRDGYYWIINKRCVITVNPLTQLIDHYEKKLDEATLGAKSDPDDYYTDRVDYFTVVLHHLTKLKSKYR